MKNLAGYEIKSQEYFVDYSEVFQIQKIDKKPNKRGALEEFVLYKPYFPGNNEGSVIFTEPVEGFDTTYKRQLVSKSQAQKTLKKLSTNPPPDYEFDQEAIEEAHKQSRIDDLVTALTYLWLEKHRSENGLSSSRRDLYNMLFTAVSRELSLALTLNPEQAAKLITKHMNQINVN
jgi:RNA polymerase-interacting CarD/CdnL/TRCF family regulator